MNPEEQRYGEDMLPAPPQQSSWVDSGDYSSSRLSSTHNYSSYPFEHSTQTSQNPMYSTGAGSSMLTSSHHPSAPAQLPSWSGVFSDPSQYGSHSQLTHDPVRSNTTVSLPSSSRLPPATSGSIRTPRVGPRKTLTDDDRREICLYHRQHPDKKQTEIGEVFGVERSTISKILRQKEKFLGEEGGPASRLAAQVEPTLLNWGLERERTGARLTPDMLKRQARVVGNARRVDAQAMAELDSSSWLDNFLQRNPGLVSFSHLPRHSIPERPAMATFSGSADRVPSLATLYSTTPAISRFDLGTTFNIPGQTSSFGSRDTFNTSGATGTSYENIGGYGYGTTTSDTRSSLYPPAQGLEPPTSASWVGQPRMARNYILSSTNPDPAGSPPSLGRSPTTRTFNLSGTTGAPLSSTGGTDLQSGIPSFRSGYPQSNPLPGSGTLGSTAQLPLISRAWPENEGVPTSSIAQNRLRQSNTTSPATSAAVSSASNSMSPGGTPLSFQRNASRRQEDEDRALVALTSMINEESMAGVPEGQEPIRDMTVGMLVERLHAESRSRGGDGNNQQEGEATRSLRRAGPEGDGSEMKRTRIQ